MKKVGVIICKRYQNCAGGKCLRALRERKGGFAGYPKDEEIEIVGYTNCGGCPGGNIEYAPEEMKKNGVDVIHLATGMLVGYPPCANMMKFKEYIENVYNIPVVIGTHPIPTKYYNNHKNLSFWDKMGLVESIKYLIDEDDDIKKEYD